MFVPFLRLVSRTPKVTRTGRECSDPNIILLVAMSVPFLRLVSREPKVTGTRCSDQHIILLVAMSVPFLRLVSRAWRVEQEQDVVTPRPMRQHV